MKKTKKKLSVPARLRPLKALLLDCDGILTDAKCWYAGDGHWRRAFSLLDGYGIHKLIDAGFLVGVITASNSEDIRMRAQVLRLTHFYEGKLDKTGHFEDFLKKTGLKESEVAYMGDDDPDVPLLSRVGFAATVPHAMPLVKKVVHYTTKRGGGDGAVREVVELILDGADFLKPRKK